MRHGSWASPTVESLPGWSLATRRTRRCSSSTGAPGPVSRCRSTRAAVSAARVRSIAVDRPGLRPQLVPAGPSVGRLGDRHLLLGRPPASRPVLGRGHLRRRSARAACARFLGDRVRAAGIVSGVGPLADPGSEGEMMTLNRVITRLARRSSVSRLPTLPAQRFALSPMAGEVDTIDVGPSRPPDTDIMSRPDVQAAYIDSYRHAPTTSALAAAQDFSLFASPWGFRLEDIVVPVHVWHGDEDHNVPLAHGRLQAERIPGARMHECPRGGPSARAGPPRRDPALRRPGRLLIARPLGSLRRRSIDDRSHR